MAHAAYHFDNLWFAASVQLVAGRWMMCTSGHVGRRGHDVADRCGTRRMRWASRRTPEL